MRLAVLADVHGNLPALEAVLDDVARDSRIDVTVNCGDIVSGAVDPFGTADRLMAEGLATVAGNHERQVLELRGEAPGTVDGIARACLDAGQLAWISSLPLTLEVVPGVLAFHGSPTDDQQYLLETVDGPWPHVRAATVPEVLSRLGDSAPYGLLLCGHTHVARSLALPDGRLVVNPGSVGWPAYDDDLGGFHVVEAGSPEARYAVVDDASGSWQVEFRSVPYDHEAAAASAEAYGRPDLAHALRTGRVPRG